VNDFIWHPSPDRAVATAVTERDLSSLENPESLDQIGAAIA
jgi:hypothetical protein